MSVNVDAVNERLNGLVTLLKAVGIDSLDKSAVDRVSKGMVMTSGGKNHGGVGSKGSYHSSSKLDDDQIEAIIRKLQMAQSSGDAPQILAALEAAASKPTSSSSSPSQVENRNNQSRQRVHQPEVDEESEEEDEEEEEEDDEEEEDEEEEEEEEEDEEDDDDDDDEGSDEFDEDANYPMVGHGVSDDISVVSDLTTPTVVSSLHVPDEEHYRDALPPMIVGGGSNSMLLAPSKRKNLVGGVRPQQQVSSQQQRQINGTAAAPSRLSRQQQQQQAMSARTSGGAAAARRKTHNSAMDKISATNNSGTSARKVGTAQSTQVQSQRVAPPQQSQPVAANKVRKPASAAAVSPQAQVHHQQLQQPAPASSTARKANRKSSMEHGGNRSYNNVSEQKYDGWETNGWNAFADTTNTNMAKSAVAKQSIKKKPSAAPSAPTTIIDNDGFLMTDAFGTSFDPFNTASTAATVANQFRSSTNTPSSTAARSTTVKKKKAVAPSPQGTQMMNGSSGSGNNTSRRMLKQPPSSAAATPAEKRREMRRRASLDC